MVQGFQGLGFSALGFKGLGFSALGFRVHSADVPVVPASQDVDRELGTPSASLSIAFDPASHATPTCWSSAPGNIFFPCRKCKEASYIGKQSRIRGHDARG